jgi:hypothetical protein
MVELGGVGQRRAHISRCVRAHGASACRGPLTCWSMISFEKRQQTPIELCECKWLIARRFQSFG